MKKLTLFLLVFVFAFASLEFADWNQFQRCSQHNATECDIPIQSPLCISWSHKLYGVLDTALPLIDGNGGLYINTSSYVYKFDGSSGAVLWLTNLGNYGSNAAGILYNNTFIYNYSNGFEALDQATGNVVWQQDVVGMTGVFDFGQDYSVNPICTLYNGNIYIGDSAGEIVVIDASTGDTVNIFKVASDSIQAAPSIDSEGVLYFGSQDGNFYAVNSSTGAIKWQTNCGTGINATASLDDSAAYVAAGANIYKFNRSDGSIPWTVLMGSFCNSTGTVLNGYYYCGCDDRYVYSINCGTGAINWKIYTEDNMCQMSCIIICSDLFVNGCVDKTVMIDVDQGFEQWVCHATTGSYTTPAYWNQHVYTTSSDSYIYAFGECGNCPCACDARPTATFEAANPGIVTETPTISPTYTITTTPPNTTTPAPVLTVTSTATVTLTGTFTFTTTTTSTYTSTYTQTMTFTFTATMTLPPTPTITLTPMPCNGVTPPSFSVTMVYGSDNANDVTFNIINSAPLQSPPSVTIYQHSSTDSGNQQPLTFTASPVSGNPLEYQVLYPKSDGSCDIDEVVVQGTDICGVTGTSDGSFEKQVNSNQNCKIFSNVINPDHNDRCMIMYNVYKTNDNCVVNIYNRNGVLIKNLVNANQAKGQYEVTWDGTNDSGDKVSSGVYLAAIKTSSYTTKEKIAVTR